VLAAPSPLFRERRAVPWWWWVVALAIAVPTAEAVVVLGPEISTRGSWARGAICLVVTVVVVASALLSLSRSDVEVDHRGLRAGHETLPAGAIGRVRTLDPAAARAVLGRDARADARLSLRPWVRTAVQIEVDQARADPDTASAPYWVVATRRPRELATALETLRDRSRGHERADADSPAATDGH